LFGLKPATCGDIDVSLPLVNNFPMKKLQPEESSVLLYGAMGSGLIELEIEECKDAKRDGSSMLFWKANGF
jgi:hypothetical protein